MTVPSCPTAIVKIWQQLRRRKVFRTAGLYIVGAWLVVQVADIFFPAWGIPETALRFLIMAAFACFPIALIFGWRYDITPHGIVRTVPADKHEAVDLALGRRDYMILIALLAIGLAIVVGSADKIQQEIDAGPTISLAAKWRENSIAVLPFTNLDINPDTGFFSDGITEEILHRLSSLKALHVLASNSSFAFRDSEESPAQIREKLGVRYLLQGSIRRENDFVRVTARLVDEGGFQVWSESFERKLEGIFAIQTEIASTVASEIIKEIVPLQELPAGRTTTDMEAYNEYLAGRALLDTRTSDWKEQAAAHFRKAIELDPGFAPPRATLAMTMTVNTGLGGSQWEEGRQLAEEALELDPNLAEAHAALGLMLLADGRLAESALSARKALNLDPSLGFAYNTLSLALFRMRRADEANSVQQKGLAVDPLNPPLVANAADNASRAGNFDRAEQLLLRLVNLPQPPPLGLGSLYSLYYEWGRFADAVAIAKQGIRRTASSGHTEAVTSLAWGYGALGMTEDADYWTELVLDQVQDDLATLDHTYNVLRTRKADSALGARLGQLVNNTEFKLGEHRGWTLAQFGLVSIQLGDFERGSEQLEHGMRLYQAGPGETEPARRIDISALRRQASPDDIVFVMHLLAYAYRQLGRIEETDVILQELADVFGLENNALHQALTGNPEGALQILRTNTGSDWSKYYGPGSYYEIINCPAWAETIKAPEFQAFLREVKEEVDRQRAIVEAADAEHDFRAEIAALLAD
jgi:TolB-like protein/Flp pilus assembly protein TadD